MEESTRSRGFQTLTKTDRSYVDGVEVSKDTRDREPVLGV